MTNPAGRRFNVMLQHRQVSSVAATAVTTMTKGILCGAGGRWRHFRWTKRTFWRRRRKAEKKLAWKETHECGN
jgi:hypothetical protein